MQKKRSYLFVLSIALVLCIGGLADCCFAQHRSSENNKRLREALQQYPQADANRDGVLTLSEAQAFLQQQKKQDKADKARGNRANPGALAPTHENVKYGPFDRNVLDIWLAESDGILLQASGRDAGRMKRCPAAGDKRLRRSDRTWFHQRFDRRSD